MTRHTLSRDRHATSRVSHATHTALHRTCHVRDVSLWVSCGCSKSKSLRYVTRDRAIGLGP